MTTDQTAAHEVFARLLCAADAHVHGNAPWEQLYTTAGRGVQDGYRDAARWLLPRMTVATAPAAVPVPPPADQTAVWLDAAAECSKAAGAYAERGANDTARALFALMEKFLMEAGKAEYVATPCSAPDYCEDGGEPCSVHERLMGHVEGDHELCAPDCGAEWQRRVTAADAVLAVLPEPTDQTAAPSLSAAERQFLAFALGLVGDHLAFRPDEFTDENRAALETLRRMAAESTVTPPPALTEVGRLRAQVQVLQRDAERDRGLAKVGARCMRVGHQGLIEQGRVVLEGWRFALSTALALGTGAPWEAIHERVKELRRMAAEEQPAETHSCRNCDGVDPDTCLNNPDRPKSPMDPVHILGIDAAPERPAVGEQPETQEADSTGRLERGRQQLLESMSAVSEDRTCCGWASDWARTLHAEGGIWETLGRAVGWPTGNYDRWVWMSWDEAAALYAETQP